MRTAYLAPVLFLAVCAVPASAADEPPNPPLLQHCEKPKWPAAALRLGQEGKVTLRYKTDHDGTVLESEVLTSSGHPLLDEAARVGLSKCKMPDAGKADPSLHAWNKIQYVWTLSRLTAEELAARLNAVRAGAERGDPASMHELGTIYMVGRGLPRDSALGMEWLRKAAERGHLPSNEAMASFYNYGAGVPRDVAHAERLLRIGAEQGLASSQALLGILLLRGAGIEARPDEAMTWLRKAADAGDVRGLAHLGMELMRKGGERSEAIAVLSRAAERGDPNAQFYLGMASLHGHGVSKDAARAAELLTRAAQAGHQPAQLTLAWLYEGGAPGVAPDPAQATHWRTEAGKSLQRATPGRPARDAAIK